MGKIKHPFSNLFRGIVLASAMAWCSVPQAAAEELKDCLIVHKHDGTKVSYVLEDTPVVTFDAENMHIAASAINHDHKLADVEKFTFDKESALEAIRPGDYRITVTDSEVLLEGFTPSAIASLCDMNGRVAVTVSVGNEGSAALSTASLPAGVYIVSTTDGKTFKFIKK